MPYVIGQWVCGPRFYGREPLLAAILDGPPAWHWLAGLRRIGKTSLLKQLDHVAGERGSDASRGGKGSALDADLLAEARASSPHRRPLLPLFWDLQGVASAEDLGLTFGEALLDAEERLAELGIAPRQIEDDDPFAALERLARAARSHEAEILLLCDEADALLDLARLDRELPPRLWRAIGAAEPVRVVLTSSVRLADLGLGADSEGNVAGPASYRDATGASPVSAGRNITPGAAADGAESRSAPVKIEGLSERFGAPHILGVFTDAEARALLRQERLPTGQRPSLTEEEVEALRERCGNHPMLLQLAAKRLQELGDLEEACRQVATDRSVGHLFAVDFELLAPEEREILRALALKGDGRAFEAVPDRTGGAKSSASAASGPGATPKPTGEPARAIARLLALGLLRAGHGQVLTIANRFLGEWLRSPVTVAE